MQLRICSFLPYQNRVLFIFTVDFHHCIKTIFQGQAKTNSYGVLNSHGHNLRSWVSQSWKATSPSLIHLLIPIWQTLVRALWVSVQVNNSGKEVNAFAKLGSGISERSYITSAEQERPPPFQQFTFFPIELHSKHWWVKDNPFLLELKYSIEMQLYEMNYLCRQHVIVFEHRRLHF